VRRPATLLLLLSLLSAPLVLPASARAATFIAQSVEETARTSDAVVRGTVVGTTSRWVGPRIFTEVEIAVTSAWKGTPGRTVTVTVPGGAVGELAQRVDAAPEFTIGEDVVVFVQRAPRGNMLRVNGLAMGKYRVENGRATPGSEGAHFEGPPVAAGEKLVQPMTVDELERRVRSAK
jgi:hypothetical protein